MEIRHFEEYDCVYDKDNNLIEVYENQILICRYRYNKHSKVTREDNLLLNTSIEYKYNEFDKLIQRSYYDYTLDSLQNVKYSDIFKYASENPNLLISYNDESFSYDKSGKPNIFRNAKLIISKDNELINLDNNVFIYNRHNRTTKIVGKTTTRFYRKNNKLIMQDNGVKLKFIYRNNSIIGFVYDNNKYYYKKNYNNDIVGIYDTNHVLICRYVYDYLGNHKFIISDNVNYTLANINPFRFHSYYFDIETGLYFTNGRYYDSEIDCYLN